DNKRLNRKNWKMIKQSLCQEVVTQDLFVVDGFYNHDERYNIAVRLITTQASAAYFFKIKSKTPSEKELQSFEPQWVI
ncbi:phosphoenolpyruvate carboxykinase (ATP), partial [Francisella tularensis]|uniref:phosphoenolpyruvate carboxykinase (ATP) n=1 Tax=Francisella tularensis TaxID=263 RepID=UPI002381B648